MSDDRAATVRERLTVSLSGRRDRFLTGAVLLPSLVERSRSRPYAGTDRRASMCPPARIPQVPPLMSDLPHVIDVTSANFKTEIVAASQRTPVVVDFWAPWCGPCRQLGPLLETLAAEYAGKFLLAKVDTEASPDLAQAFGVSSIPYVVAVRDGKLVDGFVGLQSEPQLRAWLDRVLPSPVEELLAKGSEVEATDPAAAERLYREAEAIAPADDRVRLALCRTLAALGRNDEARAVLDALAARGYLEPEAEQLKSTLELRRGAAESGGVDEARRQAEANPSDAAAQIGYADALAVRDRPQEALNLLLDLIRRDPSARDPARETMVRIFDLLGPQHPLVSDYRRKLAAALY